MDQPDHVSELGKLDPDRVAVVLVDFQNDFCRPSRAGVSPGLFRVLTGSGRTAEVVLEIDQDHSRRGSPGE